MPELFHNLYDLFGFRTPAAEWASIIALFISGYAAYAITKVRSQILGRVRLPGLVAGIEKNTTTLAGLMREFTENKERIEVELAICAANLQQVTTSVKGRPRQTANTVIREIARYKGAGWRRWVTGETSKGSRESAWSIYVSLNALIEELRHVLEDQRVGG